MPFAGLHVVPPFGDSGGEHCPLRKTAPGASLAGSLRKTAVLERQTQTRFSAPGFGPLSDTRGSHPGPGAREGALGSDCRHPWAWAADVQVTAPATAGPYLVGAEAFSWLHCHLIRAIIRLGLQDGAVGALPPLAQGRVGAGSPDRRLSATQL